MRLQISLNKEKEALLERMREGTYMSKSGYFVYLLAQEELRRKNESTRRSPGRPKKNEDDTNSTIDELPDEHAPRTLKNPYPDLVPLFDKDKLVNEYDILMLTEKAKLHESQS